MTDRTFEIVWQFSFVNVSAYFANVLFPGVWFRIFWGNIFLLDVGRCVFGSFSFNYMVIVGVSHRSTIVGNGIEDAGKNYVVSFVVGNVQYLADNMSRKFP